MIPTKPNMEELFSEFPSLALAASGFPLPDNALYSVDTFLEWMSKARLSPAQQQTGLLLATIINDYRPLPEPHFFDFAKAISSWDQIHWAAFKKWVNDSLK